MLSPASIDPQSADILRELLTSDLEKFPHSAKDIAGAVKQWRQVHQIDSDVPLWHALTPMLAWSYAQPWADQIAEETLVHKWCHIVSRNEKDTFNADSAMVFSETAAEILAVVPETKKAAFASAAFSAVHRVLGTYFKHDYQQDDDDNSLPVEDISRMMVGLGSLASVDPTALSTWDKTPLSTAYLSLVYDMWGMAAKRGDDAITLAHFLDSALPETFKRSTLFALDGATWAEAAALFTPALSAFIPATEAERAAIIPWQTLPWNGSVPLSQNQVEHSMKINMALAQALCPQLCTHMHLLDSKEFWTSRDFIRHIAQMQSPGHIDPNLDFSQSDDVGSFFSN